MFRLVSCCSLYFNDIIHLVGPCFFLFQAVFLGSGSTFGSNYPPPFWLKFCGPEAALVQPKVSD